MLEDKRNIWTSELIYIFGRATFPFLKRSERAPYPELGGEDERGVLMRQEVHLSPRRSGPGAPRSSLPSEIFIYLGEGRAAGRRPARREKKACPGSVGTSRALPHAAAAGQPLVSVGGHRRRGLATSGRLWLVSSVALGAHPPACSARSDLSRPRGRLLGGPRGPASPAQRCPRAA